MLQSLNLRSERSWKSCNRFLDCFSSLTAHTRLVASTDSTPQPRDEVLESERTELTGRIDEKELELGLTGPYVDTNDCQDHRDTL